MNFSSFVSPFSVTSAINNHHHQFPTKFVGNDDVNSGEANTDTNSSVEDGNFLRVNAESMMMAVSRYQNSTATRFNQQNLLHKYYRAENDGQENIATNSIGSSFTTTSSPSSLSLISSKFRPNDGLSSITYGNLRTSTSHFVTKPSGDQPKRCGSSENLRIQPLTTVKKEEKELDSLDVPSVMPLQSQPASTNISVASWQSIAAVAAAVAGAPAPSTTAVADYLSHLPGSSLPISLHNLFKYSTEKKEDPMDNVLGQAGSQVPGTTETPNNGYFNGQTPKKKKRKKPPKEKKPKPKPGEIRMTTALDGSALFCCPECHMAYPDKSLLEQHLLGHTIERRFFCDICGAGLKRKDHLTRHKQSHNPDRPHACSVCSKAFKRKEQLALHYVIHSGEKRHVCPECGKGFYRKDHLRKHTRSHIARRVKAELSQYVPTTSTNTSTSSSTTYNSTGS